MGASLSSVISLFSGFYESATDLRISLFLVPIDCSVNLLCIYLQYAFAAKHYDKYCGKLDWFCKRTMTTGWVNSIHTMRRDAFDLDVENTKLELEIQKKLKDSFDVKPANSVPKRLSRSIRAGDV